MKKLFITVSLLAMSATLYAETVPEEGTAGEAVTTETSAVTESAVTTDTDATGNDDTAVSKQSKGARILNDIDRFLSGEMTGGGGNDDGKPKFKFSPAGRILFDAAYYAPGKDGFAPGVAVPDIRIGGKASYGQWTAKLDIGFGYGKLSMKDIFIQYTFKGTNNLLRGGYFVHQYGLNAATSSSFKPSGEAPTSDDFFAATGRNLGIQFVLDLPKFFMGVSGITGTGLGGDNTATTGHTSFGALGRFVWRPLAREGAVVQVGVSPWIQSAFKKDVEVDGVKQTTSSFTYSANYPTRVAKVKAIGVTVDDARSVFKLTPELLLSYDRFALESQYYFMNIARKNSNTAYQAQGVYGLFRTLILGDSKYSYSHGDAGLALPKPKTLELVLGYNYTNANKAGINGGILNDYSVTLNYYINKYMLCRLAWHYADTRSSAYTPNRHVNIIQARIQFKF